MRSSSLPKSTYLRPDPLLWGQELDVPSMWQKPWKGLGLPGLAYWRLRPRSSSQPGLADHGRQRPSMAMVYGHWDRYEPRPPEHEIDADLFAFSLWVAGRWLGLDPADFGGPRLAGIGQLA